MILGVTIYIVIFLIALIGAVIFWYNKKRLWAFWWVSVMANVFAYLYLLGGYGTLAYVMQFFSIFVWPVINLGWLAVCASRGSATKVSKGSK
jgi:hypothetical protein